MLNKKKMKNSCEYHATENMSYQTNPSRSCSPKLDKRETGDERRLYTH